MINFNAISIFKYVILSFCQVNFEYTFHYFKINQLNAFRTQELVRNKDIDFFSSSKFLASALDLNVCENTGSVLKNCVEESKVNFDGIAILTDLRRWNLVYHRSLLSVFQQDLLRCNVYPNIKMFLFAFVFSMVQWQARILLYINWIVQGLHV